MRSFTNGHTRGDQCAVCCCSGPYKCDQEGCTGYVHEEVIGEIDLGDNDWTWEHDFQCDTCGRKQGDTELLFKDPESES